jgi:hypothetical protein
MSVGSSGSSFSISVRGRNRRRTFHTVDRQLVVEEGKSVEADHELAYEETLAVLVAVARAENDVVEVQVSLVVQLDAPDLLHVGGIEHVEALLRQPVDEAVVELSADVEVDDAQDPEDDGEGDEPDRPAAQRGELPRRLRLLHLGFGDERREKLRGLFGLGRLTHADIISRGGFGRGFGGGFRFRRGLRGGLERRRLLPRGREILERDLLEVLRRNVLAEPDLLGGAVEDDASRVRLLRLDLQDDRLGIAALSHAQRRLQRPGEVDEPPAHGAQAVLLDHAHRLARGPVVERLGRLDGLRRRLDVERVAVPRADEAVADLEALLLARIDELRDLLLGQLRPLGALAQRRDELVDGHVAEVVGAQSELLGLVAKGV